VRNLDDGRLFKLQSKLTVIFGAQSLRCPFKIGFAVPIRRYEWGVKAVAQRGKFQVSDGRSFMLIV